MAGIQILTDIIAPNSLFEAGVTGMRIRRNRRGEAQAGIPVVNVVWSNTRREFTWGTVPHTLAVWHTLEGLFEVSDAGGYGFLLQDPIDPTATHETDRAGRATLIDAPSHTYQAVRQWTAAGSSSTKNRTIKYLDAATFELKIAGVIKATPVDYTFNALTGVITIPADPTASDVTWSGRYYVPVHFRDDQIEWTLIRAGGVDQRRVKGPRVVLQEVKQAS